MKFYSPLRYPGGKNKLAKFIAKICELNNVSGHYVEPYAGGASVALYLLLNNLVHEITVNDYDRSIYAFWWSVKNKNKQLSELINSIDVTVDQWRKQKEIQKNKKTADLLELGFSTFFLNRTNISGIINGGIIGGVEQKGKYKIDCRFNRTDLIKRIQLIGKHKANINVKNLNALDLIKEFESKSLVSSTIFYFDPPYFIKGHSLYMNYYEENDHVEVNKAIKSIKNAHWVVSYDDDPFIEKLYAEFNPRKFSYIYTASGAKEGKELILSSKRTAMPEDILNPAFC